MGDLRTVVSEIDGIMDASSVKAMIPHILLPKNLPQKGVIENDDVETSLLKSINYFTKYAFSVEDCIIPKTIWTMHKWEKLQSQVRTSFSLNTELADLQEGDSTVLHIREQNCTIIFTKVDEAHMRAMTFRGSLPNEEIMSTAGSLKATYPETAEIVPISKLLLSTTFSRHVQSLTLEACELAMPKSRKGGHTFPEVRELSNPFLISEFIIGMLQPISEKEYTETMKKCTSIKISKKIRDEVNWKKSYIPFRRSGLWMSAKVVLQLSLQEELGNDDEARLAYKIILLQMLNKICKKFVAQEPYNRDIISQMLVKLARRSKKLSELQPSSNDELQIVRKSTLAKTFRTIDKIHSLVQGQWKTVESSTDFKVQQINRSIKEVEDEDILHDMGALKEYLSKAREPNGSESLVNLQELQFKRYPTISELLQHSTSLTTDDKKDPHWSSKSVWIYDVELFTRTKLTSAHSPKDIYTLLCAYTQQTVKLYAVEYCDPVSFSRMILTILKMIMMLDSIAVNTHPLLHQYESGIESKMFEDLLLPHNQEEITLLDDLMNYFHSRNVRANHTSIIHSGNISPSDFSVRYASQSDEMITLKNEILADMESKIEIKKNEVRVAKQECQNLKFEMDRRECEQEWDDFYEKWNHNGGCVRCFYKRALDQKLKSVEYYQRPLPNIEDKDYLQDAVVFELLLPEEIGFLRNSLAIFIGELCGQIPFNGATQDQNMAVSWTSFTGLCSFVDTQKAGNANEVKLGSTAKTMMQSHYARPNTRLDVMAAQEESFILNNGLHLNFFFKPLLNFNFAEEYLQFQIKNTGNHGPYSKLQFSLNSSRTTENQVIALQYTCPQKLILKEFITYGSMRSGHRIQLRNLYAAVANHTIALEHESVLALILQTIWEVGPKSKENLREIHADFYEKSFSLEFLELLGRVLKSNATNWSYPMVMMNLLVLIIRILELNDDEEVQNRCTQLLKQSRGILEIWWKKLEEVIFKLGTSSASANDVATLKRLLLQTALCSAFTFNICSDHLLPKVITEEKDVTFWLRTVTRMYHLVIREKIHETCSKFLRNLVHHARLHISLNIEAHIHKVIREWESGVLHDFSSSQWTGASGSTLISNSRTSAQSSMYELKYDECQKIHTVHIGILRGIFLVDGHPPSNLPENITQHTLFNRFFKHCRFQVQRDSSTFRTIHKYEDNHYEFFFSKHQNNLIIRELHKSHSLELLPPHLFTGKVSPHFINDFTHWLNIKTNEVYFRPKISTSEQTTKDALFILAPHNQNMVLRDYPTQAQFIRYVLSINSQGFKHIVRNLRRLETEEFIDIKLEMNTKSKEQKIQANLRRLNLTFELHKEDGLLYSKNFPGYYISTNQCLGTFTGLQGGLLIEKKSDAEVSGLKKLFLIQHGDIKIEKEASKPHQSVSIISTTLRKPPMFTFEVDQILHRLKAGNDKSAWLYLAALHASTSSPFPDTFTGLTGTEMALWILQSGLVWSCSPYDEESLRTLEMISKLSPHRVYYPAHLEDMQTTIWPAGLEQNSYAAFDGYSIIVDYLISCSNRLNGLFPHNSCNGYKQAAKVSTSSATKLRERAYYRNLNLYNQCAHLEEAVFGGRKHAPDSHAKSLQSVRNTSGGWMQLAKVRMSGGPYFLTQTSTISSLIMTSETLPCEKDDTLSTEIFNRWFKTDFRNNWLRLYALAMKANLEHSGLQHEFTLLLSAILYSGKVSLEQALNLHNISCFPVYFPQQQLPKVINSLKNFEPTSNSYDASYIDSIFSSCHKEFHKRQADFTKSSEYNSARSNFDVQRNIARQLVKIILKRYWPAKMIELETIQEFVEEKFCHQARLAEKISSKFAYWFKNRELMLFVEKVDLALEGARNSSIRKSYIDSVPLKPGKLFFSAILDNADEIYMEFSETHLKSLSCLRNVFETGQLAELEGRSKMEQRQIWVERINKIIKNLHDFSSVRETAKALDQAGKHYRFAPLILLRSLLQKGTESSTPFKDYAGALAVIFSHLRRLNRIIYFESDPETYLVELKREMKNVPFKNWSPAEYPEWLLLELELDVTIRKVQVQVAKHMMDMSGNGVKNGVTQLNMGEGKTSVIVPMIVSKLSSNEDMICRVTVLSSIFTTNFNLLSFTVGGLLNKRLYTVPCRRDYKIFEFLPQIQQTYDECMKHNGVIMTLPEYRLSFRLMMYNYYLQEKHDSALQVYNIENWLRQHVRDIVDESDEIFSVKYQLIYTTGQQRKIDGDSLRWVVCQKLFQILPQVASQLFDKFGPNVVEFNKEEAALNSEQFTHFRILDSKCKNYFYELMADALLDGKIDLLGIILNKEDRALAKSFFVDEHISEGDHNIVRAWTGIEEEKKKILLLVSGYLRQGVFFTALSKRWRVECGVNNKGDKLMAVPFRAKDVAAERTEFGHPDIAIVLTQLSYYYSGLSDDQLYEAFALLEKISGPEKVYNGWIKAIPKAKNIDNSIQTYKGINLLDYEQRTMYLYPVLRKHKLVIDFWLENIVFPKESKQFPGKLVMNAWDLCYEKQKHSTTGFSGTNDSSLLLPATISQQDLKKLKKTNEKLEITIQRQENQCKRSLEMGVSCNTILKFMTQDNLRVLIDAGAIVLELGNEALAQRWLDLDPTLEGVVYFTRGNELVIKTRSDPKEKRGRCDTPLKLSSYRDQLENCAVYLDDYHTRGTDLKLPTNFKACVTIGSRMRRDKLVQACMRMRKLGEGQSVQFYLSHEANNKIKEMKKGINISDNFSDTISVKDILLWVGRNSREFEEEGLPYWAASARNYTQKLAADEMFEMAPDKSKVAGETLAKQCEDPEIFDLQTIYGTYKTKQRLVEVILAWFSDVEEKLKKDGAPEGRLITLPEEIRSIISMYKSLVQKQIQKHISNHEFLFSMLEEEQEKELEPELEKQVNVERPPHESALTPKMRKNVELFVRLGGQLHVNKKGIVRLSDIFRKTTFCNLIQSDYWKGNIFATKDFLSVIKSKEDSILDSFLRPMTYITSWSPPSSSTVKSPVESMLLLSAFEVNELMPLFRRRGKEETAVTLHMFTGRYIEGQDILVNKPRLQLPLSRQGVQLNPNMMAPFLIAAGNLFYASMEEQIAFASFLGLLPRPWEDEVEAAFNSGLIEKTGFVKPNSHSRLWLCLISLFQKDPSEMVRAILRCRHDVLRDSDHTVRLLNQCAYIMELEQAEE